jgi:hypothetical protein
LLLSLAYTEIPTTELNDKAGDLLGVRQSKKTVACKHAKKSPINGGLNKLW